MQPHLLRCLQLLLIYSNNNLKSMVDIKTKNIQNPIVDISKICKQILKHRKLYYIVLPIVFLVVVLYSLSLPNYFNCTVKLSPELSGGRSNSSLSSLASSLGIDLGTSINNTSDAIRPALYPELMASVDFKAALLKVKVQPKDSEKMLTYYDYLRNGQKQSLWASAMQSIFGQSGKNADSANIDPHRMTKRQTAIARMVGRKVSCTVNKKTSVITISVTDFDPEVCTTIADSAMVLLQRFITDYRTRKARVDFEYNQKMYNEAKIKYERACKDYARYADANMNSFLETVRQKRSSLETEVQLQRNIYQQVTARLKQAEMKVQEDTPAFAVVQASTVPVKKAGPKRTMICLIAMLFAFVVITLFVLFKEKGLNSLLTKPTTLHT